MNGSNLWQKVSRLLNKSEKPEGPHSIPVSCICFYTGTPERLEEAIYSFLQQDYSGAKELVIVNDHANHKLLFKHPEVKIIKLPMIAQFRWNKWEWAVRACSHDLIFFWNVDDISLSHRISVTANKMSQMNKALQFTPSVIFFWENKRLNGPYQNTLHHGSCWHRQMFAQMESEIQTDGDRGIFSPRIQGAGQPKFSKLSSDEMFYIFRGLDVVATYPQRKSTTFDLKPHWKMDYPKLVRDRLLSKFFIDADSSVPELSTKNRKNLIRFKMESGRRRYYVFADRELAYISTSKVACTSIKTAMMAPYGIHKNVHNAWPHIFPGHLDKEHQDFFTFSFVRNPFDRLVSGYRNKIIGKPMRKRAYFSRIPTGIGFSEFVHEIVKQPDCLINGHFQSQFSKLYRDNTLLVDYLGRFENLAEDWLVIARRFNFAHELPHEMRSTELQNVKKDFREYYTEALVHLVYNRYRADFEVFGYQNEYEKLLAFVRKKEAYSSHE